MLSLPGGVLYEDDHVVSSGEPGPHPDTLAHVGVAVLLLLLAQVEMGAGGEVGAHMVLGHSPVQVRDLYQDNNIASWATFIVSLIVSRIDKVG